MRGMIQREGHEKHERKNNQEYVKNINEKDREHKEQFKQKQRELDREEEYTKMQEEKQGRMRRGYK